MSGIRILIVDDHPVVRHGLRALLATVDDFDVIGEAASGAEAIEMVEHWSPDIVLLDVRLGEQDGISVARQIRARAPRTRVILLTVHDDAAYVTRGFEAKIHGYLLKGSTSDEIMHAIRQVSTGERVVSGALQSRVLSEYTELARSRTKRDADLSEHEEKILRGIAEGADYKSIAHKLHMSEVTVRRRVQALYQKLDVTDRAAAVAVAIRRGLI